MSDILPVPHRPQLADGYCLPACVQMVLAYWGIDRDQADLARQMGTLAQAGTPGSRVSVFASDALEVAYREGDLSDLQAALAQGIPPIVLVYTRELPHWTKATAHAIVVVGFDNDSVVVNDPGMSQPAIRVLLSDFQLAWDEMANLFALIRMKRRTASA